MSIPVRGRGWHMGISSQLCLAAWMPAHLGYRQHVALFQGAVLDEFCNVSGAMWILPRQPLPGGG